MNGLKCFLNNRFVEADTAALPLNDLGIQRGYGIFDFLRVTNHIPLFMDHHLDRFFRSAGTMRLEVPIAKEELKRVILELMEKNKLPHSGIRIMLTGGASPDGYQLVQPSLAIVQQVMLPPSPELSKGYKLVTYPHQRQLPHIKTTDYLMAIWLQPWIKEKGADDVLYQQAGIISECPRSNFFMVTQDNRILTPARNILEGITRKQVLKLAARNGILLEEKEICIEDLRTVKEAFIGSSTKRIIPVLQVDDIVFAPPGKDSVTARLFKLLVENEEAVMRDHV